MQKTMFQGYSPAERRQMLEDNAIKIESDVYYRQLTEEERNENKEKLLETQNSIIREKDDQKSINREFKESLKKLNATNLEIVRQLKTNSKEVAGKLFLLSDEDARRIDYYSEEGVLVRSRPMTQEEMQKTIFPLKKAE